MTEVKKTAQIHLTPEDEFNNIIDSIELRAMASDGPVTPTLQEASEAELSRLWELINEISPKRKALSKKMLKDTANDSEVVEYLRINGVDAKQVGHEGSVFVKTVTEKIRLEKVNAELLEALENVTLLYSDVCKQAGFLPDPIPSIERAKEAIKRARGL